MEKKDIFKTWFEDGLCDSMVQKNASEQLADSVGGIWADAIAHVECTGKGYGCGWVMVDPSGWGASFAQMFINAAQEVMLIMNHNELVFVKITRFNGRENLYTSLVHPRLLFSLCGLYELSLYTSAVLTFNTTKRVACFLP